MRQDEKILIIQMRHFKWCTAISREITEDLSHRPAVANGMFNIQRSLNQLQPLYCFFPYTLNYLEIFNSSDEIAYRQEVKELAVWCSLNNRSITRSKQWRWSWTSGETAPALHQTHIMNSTVTAVESFRFLGTTISQDLTCGHSHRPPIVKKAQQRCTSFARWGS